jgi:hypothetical protein
MASAPTVFGLQSLTLVERELATMAQRQAIGILSQTPFPAPMVEPVPIYSGSIGVPPRIVLRQGSTADGVYKSVPETVWRGVEAGLGMGNHADPLAGWLLREWRTGSGPDIRIHSGRSQFSGEFKNSTTTLEHILGIWSYWTTRREGPKSGPPFRINGTPAAHRLTQGKMPFGVWQYAMGNRAAQVMGSVTISEARYLPELDKVLWTGFNVMGTSSWKAGNIRRQIREFGARNGKRINLPDPPNIRRPAAFGATIHIIQWYGDVPSWVRARQS